LTHKGGKNEGVRIPLKQEEWRKEEGKGRAVKRRKGGGSRRGDTKHAFPHI
jgi:hypothetical protein